MEGMVPSKQAILLFNGLSKVGISIYWYDELADKK
jgi:hypothetical protein